MTVPRGQIGALTGLRAVAALWVFVFHLELRAPLMPDGPLGNLAGAGAIGMTLFFVLSGYVLVLATRDGLDPRSFFRARFARLYPLYALAAVLAVPWLIHGMDTVLETALVAVIGVLMLQAWFPNLFGIWNHAASWSLSVEAAFYAVFPAVRSVLRPLSAPLLLAIIAGCSALSLVFAGAHHALPDSPGFAFAYANPFFRLPEFVAGVAFGVLALSGLRVSGRLAGGALAALVVAIAATGAPGIATLWAAPAIPVIGLVLAHLTHSRGGILASEPMRWGGNISYAFYLFQFHVITGLPHLASLSAGMFWIVAFGLTLCLAWAAHTLVERPARSTLTRPPAEVEA